MNPKTLGAIQLIGGLVAGWFGWQNSDWGVLTVAIVLLLMAMHHFMEKR